MNRKIILVLSLAGTAVGGTVLFKDLSGGPQYEGKEKLEGKTAIVTGANTGIGKEVTKHLARKGARVVMACRNIEACEVTRKDIIFETKNKNVVCRRLDLASMESIHAFAEKFNRLEKQLNILINNAGVMRCPRSVTDDGFEMQLGVNHFGHFLLTQLVIEKLKSSKPSRIVNVSGSAHARGEINFSDLNSETNYNPGSAYNQSKLANILFTKVLAEKLKDANIPVYAVNPGIVNTDHMRHMSFKKSYLASVTAKPVMWLISKTPRQGAQPILYCALADESELHSGAYYCNCKETKPAAQAEDMAAANKLWLISEKWTRSHNI